MHFFSKHFPKEKNSKAIFKQCNSDDSSSSARLREFFREHFDARRVERRFRLFQRSVIRDRDRVRLHGQYYNNIYLGKRIFGPARKQMFVHSILGGMERRFEIIDNQINHIPFTHDASDKHKEKCRNPRIKCRDDTRVVLTYRDAQGLNFIHANRVSTPVLFNDFIITQAPLQNTIADFWKLVWQEGVKHIFMLISRDTAGSHRCAEYWPKHENIGIECQGLNVVNQKVDTTRDPFFRVTTLLITEMSTGKNLVVEHWEGNLNNSSDIYAPLRLLKVSRNQDSPTIVHDHLGVSRAAVLVAIELTICNLLRGPTYKFPVQQAVHYLRSFRAFSVETPMQYIYIHRVVLTFIRPLVGEPEGFEGDYDRWLEQRAKRAFIGDPLVANVPAYRLLSPTLDPDLLSLVRHRDRPETRREIHAHIGELPIPLENTITESSAPAIVIPKMYPKGKRY
uniref:Tyrosine-protein phosphatase domain-containing protein n=1 Tax=Panagrolaimus sp. PS1159 TaxID=55785 RepID=A0AC35FAV5_9BILA